MKRLGEFTMDSVRSAPRRDLCEPRIAAERARLLIGCYRRDEVADAEVFARALIAIFCEFSESVVRFVSDPRTGIPGQSKWFPTIAEVRHECITRQRKLDEAAAWHAREAERAKMLPAPPRDRAAEVARLKAAYPDIWRRIQSGRDPDERADRLAALAELETRAAYWKSPLASEISPPEPAPEF